MEFKNFLETDIIGNRSEENPYHYHKYGINAEYPHASIGVKSGRAKNPSLPRGFSFVPKKEIRDSIFANFIASYDKRLRNIIREVIISVADIYDQKRPEELLSTADTFEISSKINKPELENTLKELENLAEQIAETTDVVQMEQLLVKFFNDAKVLLERFYDITNISLIRDSLLQIIQF